jgi:hypothetical protein
MTLASKIFQCIKSHEMTVATLHRVQHPTSLWWLLQKHLITEESNIFVPLTWSCWLGGNILRNDTDTSYRMGAPHEQSARRRGLLALLNEPLAYYPYNPELLQQTTHAMRRRGRFKPTVSFTVEGIPSDSEWTLFFLADAKHLNSLRFRPILTDFIQQSHSECTCICIPNHEDNQDLLCGGTGFSCLSWSHPNRAALLQWVVTVDCAVSVKSHARLRF